MPRVALHTLGCKLNYAETGTMARDFEDRGFDVVGAGTAADVAVINTCTVTEEAERKCRQVIRRVLRAHPDTFVIVTGCYAQIRPDDVAAIPGVDLVLGSDEKGHLFRYVDSFGKQERTQVHVSCIDDVSTFSPAHAAGERTRAFMKVQDGCDYSCSVPSWQQWCNFVAGDDVPKEEEKKVNDLLETVTDTFFSHLNHSNFSTEISPSFSDLGIGTGAIQVDEGMFNEDEPVFKFSNVPLAELYPENLKNIWRNQEIELGLVRETWPEASLPDTLEKKAKEKPYETECFINGILFSLEDRKYHQVVIHEKKKHIVFHQVFNTMRLIMFRWHVVPGERFGRGPIIQMLPSIRTANKVEQFILQNAAIQMAGVYTGVDDGIFNPHTVRIAPGTVIPVKSNSSQNPTLMPLNRAGDLGLGNFVLENIQERIRKALYADPLGEITDPVRTATEIMIRQQEMLKHAGASIGRLKTELIEPLVAACIDILVSLGKVAPIKVNGKEVTIKHVSPLAKAEDTEDFQNSQLWFSMVSQLPLPIAVASAKFEEFPAYWQKKLGVSADLVRSEDERDSEIAKSVQALVMQAAQDQQGGGNV